jgi:hypothetical protein
MLPSLDEIIIQNDLPLLVEKFTMAMCHERGAWSFTSRSLIASESLKAGWQL